MNKIKKDTTTYPIVFFMVNSTDHVTGESGLTPTVTLSKNGGAFGAAAGAVSEIGNGFYALAGNATDSNTLGTLILHAEATGADDTDMALSVVDYNPFVVAEPGDEMILTSAYDAAKTASQAGDAMTLTAAYDAAKTAPTDQEIWDYTTRTLTQAAVSPTADISAGNLTGVRGDELSFTLTGLGSLADYTAIYFTSKTNQVLPDTSATIQVVKKLVGDEGLLYLNGESATAAWGAITILDSTLGNIKFVLKAEASSLLDVRTYGYDVQVVRSTGTAVSTLALGKLLITEDQTRSIV